MHLSVRNLSRIYAGANRGLFPTSFDVDIGELIAIVGHNGAGKSTLLKMLAQWVLPHKGQVMLNGIDSKNKRNLANMIGFVPEAPNLFDFFSVEYNLKLFALLFHLPFSRVNEIMEEFGLAAFQRSQVRALSKGLRQRVNIGRSLMADPALVLFDEPTSGLDVEMTQEIYRMMCDLHRRGKTILFTTHRPDEIKDLATRIIALNQGRLVFDGSPQEYFKTAFYRNTFA